MKRLLAYRPAAPLITTASVLWAYSLLFLPHWWLSPAFSAFLLPFPVWGLALAFTAVAVEQRRSKALRIVGVTIFTAFSLLGGISIAWFTFFDNGVSAFGSAVAWFICAAGGWRRLREPF